MTGRVIDDQPTIDYILKLHNEVRSKIARGRCDQPKAGCMWPLVNINFDQIVKVEFCTIFSQLDENWKFLDLIEYFVFSTTFWLR